MANEPEFAMPIQLRTDFDAASMRAAARRSKDPRLDDKFLGKLRSTIEKAAEQMRAYNTDDRARRIAFVIINVDDSLHGYVDRVRRSLRRSRQATRRQVPKLSSVTKGSSARRIKPMAANARVAEVTAVGRILAEYNNLEIGLPLRANGHRQFRSNLQITRWDRTE